MNNLLVNNMNEEVNDVMVNIEENVNEVEENDVMVNIEENVNEVEVNVVGQDNINYEALQNLSVEEKLAFFSS